MADFKREVRVFPQLSLAQLRVFFFLTGCIVVGAVLTLSYAMFRKIEEAARAREEMVASRVFDELEREISAFLDGENAREHYQDLAQTDPALWAPFVVGYFRNGISFNRADAKQQLVAADGATSENKRRIAWALERLNQSLKREDQTKRPEPSENDERTPGPSDKKTFETAQATPALETITSENKAKATSPSATPGSKIIESLNRAPERRKQQAPAKPSSATKSSDQFNDYAERY